MHTLRTALLISPKPQIRTGVIIIEIREKGGARAVEVGRVIVIRAYRGEPIARLLRIGSHTNQQTFFPRTLNSIFYPYIKNARKSKLLYFYSFLNLLKREPRGPYSAL